MAELASGPGLVDFFERKVLSLAMMNRAFILRPTNPVTGAAVPTHPGQAIAPPPPVPGSPSIGSSGIGEVMGTGAAGAVGPAGPAGPATGVTSGELALGADVTPVQTTWTDVLSQSLVGNHTWNLQAQATILSQTNTDVEVRLFDSTNSVTLASGEQYGPGTVEGTLFLMKKNYAPGGTWTFKLQCNASNPVTAERIKAATSQDGSGNNATKIGWDQIG